MFTFFLNKANNFLWVSFSWSAFLNLLLSETWLPWKHWVPYQCLHLSANFSVAHLPFCLLIFGPYNFLCIYANILKIIFTMVWSTAYVLDNASDLYLWKITNQWLCPVQSCTFIFLWLCIWPCFCWWPINFRSSFSNLKLKFFFV